MKFNIIVEPEKTTCLLVQKKVFFSRLLLFFSKDLRLEHLFNLFIEIK
jgi:hypothetical protein